MTEASRQSAPFNLDHNIYTYRPEGVSEMTEADAIEAATAVIAQVARDHMRRSPVRGCIVTRWVCSCGEETEEFELHKARVALRALLEGQYVLLRDQQ